jgi:hypothetical protein
MVIKSIILAVPLIACVVMPLSAASPGPDHTSSTGRRCSECGLEPAQSRVVRVKMYNQPRISGASLDQILDITNRIWNAYGVTVEPSTSANALAIVLSDRKHAAGTDSGLWVLGDTIFASGHATPYIHLWMRNAEALAGGSEIGGLPFTMRSREERHAIVLQMMGVALAHELGHYLLDTTHHSAEGLLRESLSVSDLAHPNPAHLRLTDKQQRRLIATASAGGLNPDKDAIDLNVTPVRNDGTTVHRLNVKDVPVDGFWSVAVPRMRGDAPGIVWDVQPAHEIR